MGAFLQLGAFFKVRGKQLFWNRENHLFCELYGPLAEPGSLSLSNTTNLQDIFIQAAEPGSFSLTNTTNLQDIFIQAAEPGSFSLTNTTDLQDNQQDQVYWYIYIFIVNCSCLYSAYILKPVLSGRNL